MSADIDALCKTLERHADIDEDISVRVECDIRNAIAALRAQAARIAELERERIPLDPTQAMLRAGRLAVMIARLPNETVDQWIARFWGQMYTAARSAKP